MTTTMTDRDAVATDRADTPTGFQLLLRLRFPNRRGALGRVTTAIGEHGGDILDVDIAQVSPEVMVRDFRLVCDDEQQARVLVAAVAALPDVVVDIASDRTFQLHRHGKIHVS